MTEVLVQGLAETNQKVHFLDCGAPFVLEGGGLKSAILPDALHPNTEGMNLLGACIQPVLDNVMQTSWEYVSEGSQEICQTIKVF